MGGKQRTHEEFVNEVNKLYPNLKVLSLFTETKNRVRVLCKECGTESNPLAQALVQKTFCCQECRRIKNKENFIRQLSDINSNINVVGEYENNRTKIECLCLVHNKTFKMTPANLLRNHGCPKCATDSRRKVFAKTHDEFLSELKEISPQISITSQYQSAHKKIDCKCLECGFEWKAAPHSLLRGDGCPNCILPSKGELAISSYLDDISVEYISQKRFDDCRNINPLPFDFYLPEYNACIEFQGKQHYEVVEHFGGEKDFKIRRKRDNIKVEYCRKNQIELLCIPYWDFDNIKQIINCFLSERRI